MAAKMHPWVMLELRADGIFGSRLPLKDSAASGKYSRQQLHFCGNVRQWYLPWGVWQSNHQQTTVGFVDRRCVTCFEQRAKVRSVRRYDAIQDRLPSHDTACPVITSGMQGKQSQRP